MGPAELADRLAIRELVDAYAHGKRGVTWHSAHARLRRTLGAVPQLRRHGAPG